MPQIAPWCLPDIMAVEAKRLAGFVLNVPVNLFLCRLNQFWNLGGVVM